MRWSPLLFGVPALLAILVRISTVPPYAQAANTYKVLHAFGKGKDGAGVFSGVALNSKGNLYGATTGGGAYGEGTVFELASGSDGQWREAILHNFCRPDHCDDGGLVWDTPALDSKGNLYDVSSAGIFQMTPGTRGWSFRLIHGFGAESALPPDEPGLSDLLLDAAGNLYGTFGVGKNYYGAVGELSPGTHGWEEKNLFDFCLHPRNGVCLSGSDPGYRLAWDTTGNLYGVTLEGGLNTSGVVYRLEHTTGGWKERVLHNFRSSASDGYYPYTGPIVDRIGNVYGTTQEGGGGGGCHGEGCGAVYKLSRGADGRWVETILYNFPTLKDGAGPSGTLAMDPAGNLYGVAGGGIGPCGGGGCGVVYKMTPDSNGKWTYTVLHRFIGTDGALPVAGPTLDDKGKVYGTTTTGGPSGYGVVFEIMP